MCTKGKDLVAPSAIFFLCDIQEKFRDHIQYFGAIAEIASRLAKSSKLLEIPLIVTEQYPKGLGSTVANIDIEHALRRVEKTTFSMLVPEVTEVISDLKQNRKQAVLFGLETHVCIQQTALDLLHGGFEVYIVADACSSRSQADRLIALDRLRQAGCIVTTSESVLLQLIRSKDHPQFKNIQQLILPLVDAGLHPNNKL